MILKLATAENWREACRFAIDFSIHKSRSPTAIGLLDELDYRENTTWYWKRDTAFTLWSLFLQGDQHDIAGLWEALAADPARPQSCMGPHENMRESYIQWMFAGDGSARPQTAAALVSVIQGWGRLAGAEAGKTVGMDPFELANAVNNIRSGNLTKLREDPKAEPKPDPPAHGLMVLSAAGGTAGGGKEARGEFAKIIGAVLPLAETPDLTAARKILADEFPHATAAIDAILNDLAGRPTIRWRPSLLVGSAGCGKSRLSAAIPRALGLPEAVRFDGAGASDSAFGGTPRRWSTGEPSLPLEAVRRSGIANPCLLLDEIEKSGTGRTNGKFADALLLFLESETSKAHFDPFLQAPANLSMVNYIATCNSELELPKTLRDRFRLLRVPEPKAEHLPMLARTLAREIAQERGIDPAWGPADLDPFEIDVAERLWSGGSIRRLRSIVEILLTKRDEIALRH
jgi:ATP-dependent Lon protease